MESAFRLETASERRLRRRADALARPPLRARVARRVDAFFGSADREHEMSLNRALLGALSVAWSWTWDAGEPTSRAICAFLALSVIVALHVAHRPEKVAARRHAVMVADIAIVSLVMHFSPPGSAFVSMYLWISFGNGFRFGARYLAASMALSMVAFCLAVAATPHLRGNLWLDVGVVIGLGIIPAYTIKLTRSLAAAKAAAEANAEEKTRLYSELEVMHAQQKARAEVDGLTGVANRRRFDEVLRERWDEAAASGGCLALVLLDVDHFKRFNDTHGHPAGDGCLMHVARALAGFTRRPGDLAARYGGEEFAAILPGATAEDAAACADRLRLHLADTPVPDGKGGEVRVTVSAGVASASPEARGGGGLAALVAAADAALYGAKRGGRNRVNPAPPAPEEAGAEAAPEAD